jgi:hypothetical protein
MATAPKEPETTTTHPDLLPPTPADERLKGPGRPVVRTAKLVAPKPATLEGTGAEAVKEEGLGLAETPIEWSHHVTRVDRRGRPVDPSESLRHYLDKGFRLLTGVAVSELNEGSVKGLSRLPSWAEDLERGELTGEGCAVNTCWEKAATYDRGSPLCTEHDLLVGHGLIRFAGTRGGELR